MPITTDLTTDIGRVRFELGDDTLNDGVLPDKTNFSDSQIQTYLDSEGSVMGAVAALCENLSNRYAQLVTVTIGGHTEYLGSIGKQYAIRAASIRRLYGGQGRGASSGSMVKQDGYNTDDTPSDATTTNGQYAPRERRTIYSW